MNDRKRAVINEMLESFGVRVMTHGGDVDEALQCLEDELMLIESLTRDDAVKLLAYAVRRLWFRYAATVQSTLN